MSVAKVVKRISCNKQIEYTESKLLAMQPEHPEGSNRHQFYSRKRRKTDAQLSRLLEMESRRQACSPWSEALVGKILAMVPFPSIFKARTLSKSWLARFSPVASIDDEVEKEQAILFQKEVGEWSHKWETYFPAYFGRSLSLAYHVGSEGVFPNTLALLTAFQDPRTSNLSRLPSLSFLPKKFLTCSDPDMEGPLLYGSDRSNKMILYVANTLTRSWKQLPRLPHVLGNCDFYGKKLVIQTSTYRAIVFCGNGRDLRIQMYDSRSKVWTTTRFLLSKNLKFLSPAVHIDGFLYMVAYHDFANLLAFHVETRTLEPLSFFSAEKLMITEVDLVVYEASLLMLVTNGVRPLRVLKLDTGTGLLLEVARGPPAAVCQSSFELRRRKRPVCNGNSIYFGIDDRMLEYNVKEDEWRCLDIPSSRNGAFPFMIYCEWSAFSFQPGLNPFVEV